MPGVQRAEAFGSSTDAARRDEATVVRGVPAEEGPMQQGEALHEVRGEPGAGVQGLPGERSSYTRGVGRGKPGAA